MIVISLYDFTGIMVKPWRDAGHECICVDILHPKEGRFEDGIAYINLDLSWNSTAWQVLEEILMGQRGIIFGFPPCTDLAASGAMHWTNKELFNPKFQDIAAACVVNVEKLANKAKMPYMIENPRGALSRLYRKPDFEFDPFEFGGWLPPDDEHPLYPNKITGRDAYPKLTCIWSGNGFIIPDKLPVQPRFVLGRSWDGKLKKYSEVAAYTGGDSLLTKNIRSATPRGFALAVYYANKPV